MQERNELLKSLGFSDEFIEYLNNYNQLHKNFIPVIKDPEIYKTLDSISISQINQKEIVETNVNINKL